MTGLIRSSAKGISGLARAVSKGGKKLAKATIPKEVEFGIADKLDSKTARTEKQARQIRFGPKALEPAREAVIPLPDEEALELARRRRSSRRRGSRASTVLSGGEAEGY